MSSRPYQDDLKDGIRAALADGYTAPCAVLPTGGGKTHVFSEIAEAAAARGNRVLILVHRRELMRQASRHLSRLGVQHGLIAPGMPYTSHAIQIASEQTLSRRAGLYRFNLIIPDETHHSVSNTRRAIIEANDGAVVIGFTATPARLSGVGLGAVHDTLVLGPSIQQLQHLGFLSRCRLIAPPIPADFKRLRVRAGDFDKRSLDDLLNRREITGCVVEQYIKHCNGYPAVVFCGSVQHAYDVADSFRDAGFRAAAVDGGMDEDARDAAIAGLGDGSLNVLTSCDLISEGVDIPVISAALLLRPTKSICIYLQQVGRALRPYPGKESALILDHVGNYVHHGHPAQDREWCLERGHVPPSSEAAPRTRQCNHCFYVHEYAPACPECGYEYPKAEREQPRQVDGDLEEVTAEEAEALWAAARKSGKLSDYHKAAKATGKTPGSAWHAWKRRRAGSKLAGRAI